MKLGTWTCRSGNSVDALLPNISGIVELRWDSPPPLSPADLADYEQVILPALLQRLREYTEALGPALYFRI